MKPHPAYFHLYPFPEEVIANLAYFFAYEYCHERDVLSYTQPLWFEVEKWWNAEEASALFCVDNGLHLLIWDLRPVAVHPLTVLTGLQRTLYGSCQTARTINELKQLIEKAPDGENEEDIQALLEPLVKRGLMIRDQKSYLSLAIPLGVYQLKGAALRSFCLALEEMGWAGERGFTLPIPEAAFCASKKSEPLIGVESTDS
ncbi:hypothetical protein L0152_03170 [bacterium]|nr:hypothetical protein [bacterium]